MVPSSLALELVEVERQLLVQPLLPTATSVLALAPAGLVHMWEFTTNPSFPPSAPLLPRPAETTSFASSLTASVPQLRPVPHYYGLRPAFHKRST